MATFDDSIGGGLTTGAPTPKYGQRKVSRPNTRIVRFADGYEQRIVFGLQTNQNPRVFTFTFDVSQADAVKMEAFLDDRGEEGTSFDFHPPGEASTFKFVCETWSKTIPYVNRAIIQATFRQVFEP